MSFYFTGITTNPLLVTARTEAMKRPPTPREIANREPDVRLDVETYGFDTQHQAYQLLLQNGHGWLANHILGQYDCDKRLTGAAKLVACGYRFDVTTDGGLTCDGVAVAWAYLTNIDAIVAGVVIVAAFDRSKA